MKKEVYIKDKSLQEGLNRLLSDYQVYYQNLRAFHWLVKGQQFYQLHEKFEEFYNQAAEDIDEIAERILMIGGKPLHSFEDYLKNASIRPEKDLVKASDILPVVVQNTEFLLGEARKMAGEAGDADDEGTVALMSDFIAAFEKRLWMLNNLQA